MTKINKNQYGFSALEFVLVILVLAAIAGAGWFVYKNHNKSTVPSSNSSSSSTTNPPANLYAGWKTYTSQDEKFSIKYPSGWSVINDSPNGPEGNMKESATIQGPNNFALSYTLTKYDPKFTVAKAQAADQSYGNSNFIKRNTYSVIDNFIPTNYTGPLYIVSTSAEIGEPGGPANSILLSSYKNYATQPLGYAGYYIAININGYLVQWYGAYSKPAPSSGPVGMSPATFLAKHEVKVAVQMLKTLSY
jgi:hypothetical protein